MIRKGTKKVIPYNNDYEPTKIAKGDKVIFDYEKKTASGKEVSIVSDYKPKPYLEVNGAQLQNTDKVPVLSVEGKAEIVDGNILGAGEYLSNQLVKQTTETFGGDHSNTTSYSVVNDKMVVSYNGENADTYFRLQIPIKKDKKYLLVFNVFDTNESLRISFDCPTSGENRQYLNIGENSFLFTALNDRTHILLDDVRRENIYPFKMTDFVFHCLDDLGLQDLTLDQLKAQRPDLFVPQPYHTTEKRIGMIFNDGSVDRLDLVKLKIKDFQAINRYDANTFFLITEIEFKKTPDLWTVGNIMCKPFTTSYYNNSSQDIIAIGTGSQIKIVSSKYFDSVEAFLNEYGNEDVIYLKANPQPLYAVNDIKDEYKTNGVVSRNVVKVKSSELVVFNGTNYAPNFRIRYTVNAQIKTYNINNLGILGNGIKISQDPTSNPSIQNATYSICKFHDSEDLYVLVPNCSSLTDARTYVENHPFELLLELATPTTEHREPIAESRFDTINSIVNEDFTSSEEDTPSPSYPREIEHTSKFKWNDLELPLDLYNGDKIIASRKVGKNIWDEEWELGAIAWTGVDYASQTRIRSSYIKVKQNTQYFLKCGDKRYEVFYYDINKNLISYNQSSVANGNITTPSGCEYIRFTTNSSFTETTYNHDIMICLASEVDKTYEPYLKDKVWGYKVKGSVDLGSLNYSYNEQYKIFTQVNLTLRKTGFNALCDKYRLGNTVSWWVTKDKTFTFNLNPNYAYILYIRDDDYTNSTDFKNSLSGTKLVYELAQPQWVDITETHSQLLHDLTPNTTQEISVDNGTLQVDYYKAKE